MHQDDAPRCTTCTRPLQDHETADARLSCRPCQDRADHNLRALAGPDGLYARLAPALAPGGGTGEARVSGSRTAPLPLRLEPLSLAARGGVVTVLQTWVEDWATLAGRPAPWWRGAMQQQLDDAVASLRFNLEWAATRHPAFGEFAAEVAQLVRDCQRAITGERAERTIRVQCDCGGILRITVSTDRARCPRCDTHYGRDDILSLPLAPRADTAA
ncbi:hypothetical protein GCM10010406_21430 [Streptomyces thermolineatus]|uniref:Uncharacterized protein n=1 Tax=Streptomyces thermolineatus TaxID=44033 RepID=A0ABP5YTC2_9ACTN